MKIIPSSLPPLPLAVPSSQTRSAVTSAPPLGLTLGHHASSPLNPHPLHPSFRSGCQQNQGTSSNSLKFIVLFQSGDMQPQHFPYVQVGVASSHFLRKNSAQSSPFPNVLKGPHNTLTHLGFTCRFLH